MRCLILLRARDVATKFSQSRLGRWPACLHDLDDVAVLQPRAQRDHLAVDARPDALMAQVGVDRVREVDRGRAARQRFHQPLRREDVDLFRVELDLQVLDELLRVVHFLLRFEQLAHPLEVAIVALVADAPFLVLPVRRDPLLRPPVLLHRPDLDLERHPVLADHRGVQRLVAVGTRHRNEVLDPPGHRRPRLMNDAERGVAVLHAVGDDAERDEVVDLSEIDLLPLEFLMDAPEALDAAVDLDDRNLRLGQLRGNGFLQLADQPLGGAPLEVDFGPERLVGLRLEIAEGELLELVLHLAHAEAVGDRRVDVARLLRDLDAAVLAQMPERPHVVQAVGELHEDDADVVNHREQHLPEVLRLPLLARGGRQRNGADLGHALDDVGDFGPEQLADPFDRGEGVLDDVMEEAGGDRHGIQLHVRQEVGNGQGMDEVGLPGMANLAPVLEGRKDVGPAEQLDVGVRAVGPHFFEEILEANHDFRCLIKMSDRSEVSLTYVFLLHYTGPVSASPIFSV